MPDKSPTAPDPKSAIYKGPSHAEGCIPVVIDDTHPVEVEGDEYKICSEAYNSSQ